MESAMQSTVSLVLPQRLRSLCPRSWCKARSPGVGRRIGLQNSNRIQRRFKGYIAPAGEQAHPITGYYAEMLKKTSSQAQISTHTATESPSQVPVPKVTVEENPGAPKEELFAKARLIFGSTDAIAERRQEIASASKNVAGIMVPPKPDEPDNCCMSGCVNCVWDMYRDEMEEWAEKSAQARAAIQAQRQEGKGTGSMVAAQSAPGHVAVSMDDDGGGSETNWSADIEQDKLFDDIPVGIREFMRTEKKLKQTQRKEQAAAA